MDLMSIRRGLMMGMAGNVSVLDKLFDIVDAVTPTDESNTIVFNALSDEGGYVIVSNPPGNLSVAALQEQTQILSIVYFAITGLTSPSARHLSTVMARKSPAATTAVDYWSPVVTIGDGTISVQMASGGGATHKWLSNFTYYLLKIKGM